MEHASTHKHNKPFEVTSWMYQVAILAPHLQVFINYIWKMNASSFSCSTVASKAHYKDIFLVGFYFTLVIEVNINLYYS